MGYYPEDFEHLKVPVEEPAADIDFDDAFGANGETAYRKAIENGLDDRAEDLLNNTGAAGHSSGSEADFAAMGYLYRAGLSPDETAAVLMQSMRGDDIRKRHPNWRTYLKRGLGKIYANGETAQETRQNTREEGGSGENMGRPFGWRRFAEVEDNPIPAPPVLIDKCFLEGDLGIVTGPYDSLKSRLGVEIAVAIATGKKLLDRFDVLDRGAVIIIQGELHPGVYDQRLRAYRDLENDLLRQNLILISRAGFRIQPNDMSMLENIMREELVKAVLIDPLSEAYPLDPKFDENKATCVTDMLELLKSTRDRLNALMMIFHHDPKGEDRKARGSGRLMDAPDVRIEMQGLDRKEDELARSRVRIRSRNIIAPDPFDVVCGNDGRLHYSAPSRPAQDEVLEVVRKAPGSTTAELAEMTGKAQNAVYHLLRQLEGHRRVRKETGGASNIARWWPL